MGICFGTSSACLVAPTAFLESDASSIYREIVGGSSMRVFRLKCLFSCTLFGTAAAMLIWMAYVAC
jgi:hypothetical protein